MRLRYTLNRNGKFVGRHGEAMPEIARDYIVGLTADIPVWLLDERPTSGPGSVRSTVHERSRGRCEHCGYRGALVIHHRTYERFPGNELPDDLAVLCRDCHTVEHARLITEGKPLRRPRKTI